MNPKSHNFYSKKKIWLLAVLLISLIVVLAGLTYLMWLGKLNVAPKVFMGILSGIFLVVIIFSFVQLLVTYTVTQNGILLRSVWHREFLSFQDIKGCRLLTSAEASALWKAMQDDEIDTRMTTGLSGYSSLSKKYKYLTRYCTITPIQMEVGQGSGLNITAHNSYNQGSFILLRIDEERKYLLTPVKAEEMINVIRHYVS